MQRKRLPAMSPEEFEHLWRTEIKAANLAVVHRKLQTPYPTVRDWNSGINPIPGVARAALELWAENQKSERKIKAVLALIEKPGQQDAAQIILAIERALEDDAPLQKEEKSLWR